MTPILLLTAKTQIDDKVSGLDAGADDYLTKPFATEELLARIRAMVRRHSDYSGQSYAYGDIQLDADQLELSCRNSVRLSIKEFELLRELIVGAGHSISTDFLIKRIWSREPGAHADTVWLYIAYLKRKLAAVNSKLQIEGEKHGSYMLK